MPTCTQLAGQRGRAMSLDRRFDSVTCGFILCSNRSTLIIGVNNMALLDQLDNNEQTQFEYIQEELKNEIDRGNDLCKIIYKMVSYEPLEMYELARIANIINNIKLGG